MKVFTVFAFLAFSSQASLAAWEFKSSTDAMTDRVSKEAVVMSTTGDKFTITVRSDNSVWGYIQLAKGNQFMVGEELMIRVDKNQPSKFSGMLDRMLKDVKLWEWNPSLIGFRIFHGDFSANCGAILPQYYNGEKMLLRYHLNQSTQRDLEFDINGNREALSQTVGHDLATCPRN